MTRLFFPLFALLLVALVATDHWSARPDMTRFDPEAMGRTEAAMWRDYYDGHWLSLGARMAGLARTQYGFSWWDSARASFHAARAALHFRRGTDDPRCLPALVAYYDILAPAMPAGFSSAEAAALELRWWTERRRRVPEEKYARTIATLAGMCHGITAAAAEPASRLRADMMAYRDARRDGRMTENDWEHVAARLREAWGALRAAVDAR